MLNPLLRLSPRARIGRRLPVEHQPTEAAFPVSLPVEERAKAIAEAVQRPTMHFVSIKTPEQMDLLALHRVRSRLVRQRTGVANQIRGFLLERGITVRQGVVPLRRALPDILSANTDVLSPRMVSLRPGAGLAPAGRSN